jgi:hypothetical protein
MFHLCNSLKTEDVKEINLYFNYIKTQLSNEFGLHKNTR